MTTYDNIAENTIIVEEDGSQWISVKEAAALCGVSASTMRRRGKNGEIKGKYIPNSIGNSEMYVLLLEDVERVKSAFQMLTVKKENSNQDMAFAIARLLGEYMQERDNQVLDKINVLEQQNLSLQGQLQEIKELLQAQHEKQHTEDSSPIVEDAKPKGLRGWLSSLKNK